MREEERLKGYIKEAGRMEASSGMTDHIMSLVAKQKNVYVYEPVISKQVLRLIIAGIFFTFLGVILFAGQGGEATSIWLETAFQLDALRRGLKVLDITTLGNCVSISSLSPIYGYAFITLALALILITRFQTELERKR